MKIFRHLVDFLTLGPDFIPQHCHWEPELARLGFHVLHNAQFKFPVTETFLTSTLTKNGKRKTTFSEGLPSCCQDHSSWQNLPRLLPPLPETAKPRSTDMSPKLPPFPSDDKSSLVTLPSPLSGSVSVSPSEIIRPRLHSNQMRKCDLRIFWKSLHLLQGLHWLIRGVLAPTFLHTTLLLHRKETVFSKQFHHNSRPWWQMLHSAYLCVHGGFLVPFPFNVRPGVYLKWQDSAHVHFWQQNEFFPFNKYGFQYLERPPTCKTAAESIVKAEQNSAMETSTWMRKKTVGLWNMQSVVPNRLQWRSKSNKDPERWTITYGCWCWQNHDFKMALAPSDEKEGDKWWQKDFVTNSAQLLWRWIILWSCLCGVVCTSAAPSVFF